MKTLSSLEGKGVYVNDYPGLIMDGKDISFFSVRFSREELRGDGSLADKRDRASVFERIMKIVADYNTANGIEGTDKEVRIFYLDDAGSCLLGRVEDEKETLRLKTNKRFIEAERVFQLNLIRVYAAEGIDGVYQVRHAEAKGVNDALGKFIAAYMHGWIGLFRQYETVRQRTIIFRRYKPFKLPFFGKKESLKNPTFTIQLGVRSTGGDDDFKPVITTYKEITLEDALSV
jgi:hypothetical protein